jgi:hypothetical protein
MARLAEKMKTAAGKEMPAFLENIPAFPDRPRKAYQKPQRIIKLKLGSFNYPVVQTYEDVERVSKKLKEFNRVMDDQERLAEQSGFTS